MRTAGPDSAACSCREALARAPPCLTPHFPVLLNSSSQKAQAREWELVHVTCITSWGLAVGSQPHNAQEAAAGVGSQWGTVASSTAGCGAAGPGPSAWAAEYIFYLSETSIFLGPNPSCHCINIATFMTLLSLLAAVILVGPGPCITPGSQL